MFSRGYRGLKNAATWQKAFRQVTASQAHSPRSYSRVSSLQQTSWSRPRPSDVEDTENLDTTPRWSIDPRTQEARPGSNWTYSKELFALTQRLGYDLPDLPKLQTALTHRSWLIQRAKEAVEGEGEAEAKEGEAREEGESEEHNSRLSFLGRTLVHYFVTEHLLAAYPNMQADVLANLCTFMLNDEALVKCADYVGLTELIRSQRRLGDPRLQKIIVRALHATVSCLQLDQGPAAARKFVTEFIISKMAGVDLHEVIKLQHPRLMLKMILVSQGLPQAESRLLKETGRATHFPTFVVGVYSGEKLLGEGCGTSLKRAEREAIVAALHEHFSTQLASASVPQDDYEREGDIDLFQPSSSDKGSEQTE